MGLFVAAAVVIGVSSSASADNQGQQGKQAPEVPLAAGLPVVATLTGATAYVVARARTSFSKKHSRTPDSETDTE
ncbi:MAG: hypothetical protein DWI48_06815 [Chloroflexi bacterium]|nr:MAG: hypothetical protein DWI48_06815 [Chloroflexota bacterium]